MTGVQFIPKTNEHNFKHIVLVINLNKSVTHSVHCTIPPAALPPLPFSASPAAALLLLLPPSLPLLLPPSLPLIVPLCLFFFFLLFLLFFFVCSQAPAISRVYPKEWNVLCCYSNLLYPCLFIYTLYQ